MLDAVIALDFDGYWKQNVQPRVEQRIAALRTDLTATDPAGVVSTLMGVPVDPELTLLIGAFAQGQQYLRRQCYYVDSGLKPRDVVGSLAETMLRTCGRSRRSRSAYTKPPRILKAPFGVWFSCFTHTSAPVRSASSGHVYCGVPGKLWCTNDSAASSSDKVNML